VRVLLCDDQVGIRSYIRRKLANLATIEIIGEATGGRAGIRMALELKPDIVIMDVSMPDLNGVRAMNEILAAAPDIKVIIFSAERSPQLAEQALMAGARAYLVKSGNADELIQVVQLVLEGKRYISPGISQRPAPLPSEQEPVENAPQVSVPAPESLEPVRVILVDDIRYFRVRLAEMLSASQGVQVVGQAGDAPTALRLIEELQPDVLVLDIDLPGQSGMDLLASIPKEGRRLLIIILTNYDYPVLRHGCAKLGADFYFYKPVEFERVREVCEDLAKRRFRKNQAPPQN